MKNKILLILCSLVLTACPGPEPDIDVDVNILTQYKWYARFENIDISDDYDYAWLQRGYTYLFFLEDGIGRNYTWQRSEDSDGDISRGGEITRFTYTVSGNIVHIDYGAFSTNLRLSGKELLPADGGDFGGQSETGLSASGAGAGAAHHGHWRGAPYPGACGAGRTGLPRQPGGRPVG